MLIEGVLFRARYLGSTQLACEGQPTKATRMLQAEEAVSRIKVLYKTGFFVIDPTLRPIFDPSILLFVTKKGNNFLFEFLDISSLLMGN